MDFYELESGKWNPWTLKTTMDVSNDGGKVQGGNDCHESTRCLRNVGHRGFSTMHIIMVHH